MGDASTAPNRWRRGAVAHKLPPRDVTDSGLVDDEGIEAGRLELGSPLGVATLEGSAQNRTRLFHQIRQLNPADLWNAKGCPVIGLCRAGWPAFLCYPARVRLCRRAMPSMAW